MREEWSNQRLADVVELIGGGTPKRNHSDYWGGDIPWLSVRDFNNDNRYVYYTEETITEEGVKNSSTKILSPGQIIISARGTVGALAQLVRPMAFNQSCYGINAKDFQIRRFDGNGQAPAETGLEPVFQAIDLLGDCLLYTSPSPRD